MNHLIFLLAIISLTILIVIWLKNHLHTSSQEKSELAIWLSQQANQQQMIQNAIQFSTLYQSINSQAISVQERKRLNRDDDVFIYGEIDFISFAKILALVSPKSGEIFYDLGSGAGKAVYAAAILYDFSKTVGVELLPGLHDVAQSLCDTFQKLFQSLFVKDRIVFINADILHVDLSIANVIFINATCFNYTLWQKILSKIANLKIGTRVIVVSKKVNHSAYQLISESFEWMSWGLSVVRVYQKIS